MEEKKVIKVRLITAVLLILLFIMLIAYIVLVSIEKHKANINNDTNIKKIETNNANVFNIYEHQYEKGEYQIDLDGDGTKEKIEILDEGNIKINQKEYNIYFNKIFILDLNNDANCEIITRSFDGMISPIKSKHTIYNYIKNDLIEVDAISITGNIPDSITVKDDILSFNYEVYESNNIFKSVNMTLKNYKDYTPKKYSNNINVVTSLEDEITTNSAWCGTFQLVWNDMVNNIVKQDVKFYAGDNLKIAQKIADNLDKQTFTEKELAEKDYYKVYDLKTLELKEKIETSIKEKFNETSDVLDDIDWSDAPKDNSGYDGKNEKIYIFYTILKKIFNFENNFDELENDKFAGKFENIKYFGINEDSNSKLYSQVEVLYYNTNDDFAVILNTKEGEQVILARGLEGNTFASMYNDIVTKTNSYDGNKEFTENDYLKVPNIKLNVKRNFDELCNKFFLTKNEERGEIKKAIQTIQLDMDKSGGKIKSEAIIEGNFISSEAPAIKVEHRYFYLNDEFTMFLKEKDKELPYFAANIEDITLFQD